MASKMIICKFCGTKLPKGSKVCTSCGKYPVSLMGVLCFVLGFLTAILGNIIYKIIMHFI
jgi:hypothetical protein